MVDEGTGFVDTGTGVGILEQKIKALENLLALRGHSAREVVLEVLPLVLADCPVPAGIVRKGREDSGGQFTVVTFVNQAFYECFRHKPEDVVGKPYYNFIDGDKNEIIEKLSGVPVEPSYFETIRVRKKNGDTVPCQLIKHDLYMPFCGRDIFVLSWFYLNPVEGELKEEVRREAK